MSLSATDIAFLLEKEQASFTKPQLRRHFLAKFDEAALFLLDMQWENLFEPYGITNWTFRCKGCNEIIERVDRQNHHREHKREYDKCRD